MAAPTDHYDFPSKEEIAIIKSEIIALENEVVDTQKVIEQALLRLDELTEQVKERKSRIAPVRMAGFDVLSSIFECCSEIDWMSPLAIGGVSRYWREVLLLTPRAWCFIDMSGLNRACINAYFKRSGQCSLHVALTYPEHFGLVTQVAHRVQCLAIPLELAHLKNLIFPSVTRLRTRPLHYAWEFHNPVTITPSHFPNLRHLELRHQLDAVNGFEDQLSLQTLVIRVVDRDGWRELLTSCKETLVSLQITRPAGRGTSRVPRVELPNLRYLKVVNGIQNDCSWASPLVTPTLRVYWEESKWSQARAPREHTQSIIYLRLERVPFTFPTQLRVLQLDILMAEFHSLISDLENDPSLCPHLEILEFGRKYVADFELAEMEEMLGECDWHTRPGLVRPPRITAKWSVSLPDEIGVEVRYGLPFETL
jgi:hypothetical protein